MSSNPLDQKAKQKDKDFEFSNDSSFKIDNKGL